MSEHGRGADTRTRLPPVAPVPSADDWLAQLGDSRRSAAAPFVLLHYNYRFGNLECLVLFEKLPFNAPEG